MTGCIVDRYVPNKTNFTFLTHPLMIAPCTKYSKIIFFWPLLELKIAHKQVRTQLYYKS